MDGQPIIKQYALIYRCKVQKKPTLQVNMHLQKAKKNLKHKTESVAQRVGNIAEEEENTCHQYFSSSISVFICYYHCQQSGLSSKRSNNQLF